jgi:hypothetical protein
MADPALLEVLRHDKDAMRWLRYRLKQVITDAHKNERICLAFEGSPTMVLATQRLAAAHKAAAEAYAAALVALDGKETT